MWSEKSWEWNREDMRLSFHNREKAPLKRILHVDNLIDMVSQGVCLFPLAISYHIHTCIEEGMPQRFLFNLVSFVKVDVLFII